VRLALEGGRALAGRVEHSGGDAGDGVGAGKIDRLGLAAERTDPFLHLTRVRLGLPEVLLEALLVRRAGRHRDVRLQRSLELRLLGVRLVEVLNQLYVAGLQISHVNVTPFPWVKKS
jgi:hypothetical protein